MSDPQDLGIPKGFEHLFPQAEVNGGNRRSTNSRRSSILKQLDTNLNGDGNRGDERRVSRRVSFARNMYCQELFPDGTTHIVTQELRLKGKVGDQASSASEEEPSKENAENVSNDESGDEFNTTFFEVTENVNPNAPKAADFLSKLKPKRAAEEMSNEETDPVPPKKSKKSRKIAKSYQNFLQKHYDQEDDKDYDTLFNTSINKYGREIVSRDERPDITQMFKDGEDGANMEITSMALVAVEASQVSISCALSCQATALGTERPEAEDNRTTIFSANDCEAAMSVEVLTPSQTLSESSEGRSETDYASTAMSQTIFETTKDIGDIDLSVEMGDVSHSVDQDVDEEEEAKEKEERAEKEPTDDPESVPIEEKESVPIEEKEPTGESPPPMEVQVVDNAISVNAVNPPAATAPQSLMFPKTTSKIPKTMVLNRLRAFKLPSAKEKMSTQANKVKSAQLMGLLAPVKLKETIGPAVPFARNSLKTFTCRPLLKPIATAGTHPSRHTSSGVQILESPVKESLSEDPVVSRADQGVTLVNREERGENPTFDGTPGGGPDISDIGQNISASRHTSSGGQIVEFPVKKAVSGDPVVSRADQGVTLVNREEKGKDPTFNGTPGGSPDISGIGQDISASKCSRPDQGMALVNREERGKDQTFDGTPEGGPGITDIDQSMSAPKHTSSVGQIVEFPVKKAVSGDPVVSWANQGVTLVNRNGEGKDPTFDRTPEGGPDISDIDQNISAWRHTSSGDQILECPVKESVSEDPVVSRADQGVTLVNRGEKGEDPTFDGTPEGGPGITDISQNIFASRCSQEGKEVSLSSLSSSSSSSCNTSQDSVFGFCMKSGPSEKNSSFFCSSVSSLNMTYIAKDDTLCLMADELDRKLDIFGDLEASVMVPRITSDPQVLPPSFEALAKFDSTRCGAAFEKLNQEKAIVSFMWGTLFLEISLGSTVSADSSSSLNYVKPIDMLKVQSVLSEKPLKVRANWFPLQFSENQRPFFQMAHEMAISLFEETKYQLIAKFPTSNLLDKLLEEVSHLVLRAQNLLIELRLLSAFNSFQFMTKTEDTYNIAFEVIGMRRNLRVVLPINPNLYPFARIRPQFLIHSEDSHLYCQEEYTLALEKVPSGRFDYLQKLLRATKIFIWASKQWARDAKKKAEGRKELEAQKTLKRTIQ